MYNFRQHFPALENNNSNIEFPMTFSHIIEDESSTHQKYLPSGRVKLSKNKQGTINRTPLITSSVDTAVCNIAVLEHNIDLSFEFEKNRYFHPYQQKYQDTFNNSDSESDLEELDE